MEVLLFELAEHVGRVGEAGWGELVVALPIDVEPSGVEVDDIGGYFIGSKLLGNVEAFGVGEVGDATHPCSEAPEWEHGTFAGDIGILVEDVFWLPEEDEDVGFFIGHEDAVGSDVGCTEVAGEWSTGVEEDAVATVAEEEWHGLVHLVGFGALWVGDG